MATKRDRVNRVKGLVYLPIDGSRLVKGERVNLTHVQESDIFPDVIKDPMEMSGPINGDAVGDAIFDAMLDGYSDDYLVCDAMASFGTGSIVLHKILQGTGFDPNMRFNVRVSLGGSTPVLYTMKAGQAIILEDIRDGTPYEVTEEITAEQLADGYSLQSIDPAQGVVNYLKKIDVSIINKYERPQFYGSLLVSLIITGTGFDEDKVFKVTVQFSEPVNYSVNGSEPIAMASRIYVARLKHGQSVLLGHILVGATYNVVAVPLSPQDIESGYEYSSVTGGSGSIVRDATATSIVNYAYYGATGSLIVTASVDNPVEGKLLHIAITFSRVVNYSVNGGSPLRDGSSVYVATLAHNESAVISNIPNGVSYAVTPSITATELTDGYSPDTSDGAYPRRGTLISKNSPEQVVVKFAKTNE